jgi:type I restriction enzyme R subunit
MRQAIEEGFILDVLANYTTYTAYWRLLKKIEGDPRYDKKKAKYLLKSFVELSPHAIDAKVRVMVEHFAAQVQNEIGGRAKAMIVTRSRLHALRYKLAVDSYLAKQQYPFKALVAFSGAVEDGGKSYTETGMNGFSESQTAKMFERAENRFLIVANKFQTGFDQPLLCGMYVDKRLAGIQAVQTLSRLNRAYPRKETTYVLDFVNDPADVLAAFKVYYDTAQLADVTDPNLVYNLRAKLDAAGHYDEFEVERVVAVELKPDAKQSELVAAVEPVVDRLHRKYKAAQEALKLAKEKMDDAAASAAQDELNALLLFQSDMSAFQRLYTYLSQIFDYGNTDIEKRWIFFRQVLRLLEFGREREGIDLSKVMLTHHTLKNQGTRPMPLSEGENPKLEPITEAGSGRIQEKQKAWLSEIIKQVNDLFEGDLTDQDKLVYVNDVIKGKLLESETLRQQATNNTKEQFSNSPDLKTEILNAVMSALEAHTVMSTQALSSEAVREGLKDVLLGPAQLYEALREEMDRKSTEQV